MVMEMNRGLGMQMEIGCKRHGYWVGGGDEDG